MIKQALARFAKGAKGCLVVLEASGGYERPLTGALTRFKADFSRVNPRHAREYARATGKLAKTDRAKTDWVDAEMLARMGRALELQPTPPAPPERVELAERVARRDDLVAMIGAERNRLGQSHNAWIRTQIISHINGMVRPSPIAAPKACASGSVANCCRVRSRGGRPRAATKWAAFFRQNASKVVRDFMVPPWRCGGCRQRTRSKEINS